MSWWTYITGTIEVSVPGRTQAECDYILRTVLDHLPPVTGSEHDMEIFVNKSDYLNTSCSHDELGDRTENLVDFYGNKTEKYGWLEYNSHYIVSVTGSFRDRVMSETVKEFMNWMTRFSKRMQVESVLVKIHDGGWHKPFLLTKAKPFGDMYECPSWCNDTGEPAWWEYLMWNRWENWSIPLEHVVKYYQNGKADEEWDKRLARYKC